MYCALELVSSNGFLLLYTSLILRQAIYDGSLHSLFSCRTYFPTWLGSRRKKSSSNKVTPEAVGDLPLGASCRGIW